MTDLLFKIMSVTIFVLILLNILIDVPYWCGKLNDQFDWRKRGEANVMRVRENKTKIRLWLNQKLKELGD